MADPGEECDGLDLRGIDCTALVSPGTGNFHGGALQCSEDCTYDTGSCTYCGDGTKNGPEDCDGLDLGGETCLDHGFDGGDLTCNVQCSVVTAACENCEGDSTGMYGSQGDAGCGGMSGSYGGKDYSICIPGCTTGTDCDDPELEFCPVQPTCENTKCYIVCESDQDCPGGMFCVGDSPYDFCAWEI